MKYFPAIRLSGLVFATLMMTGSVVVAATLPAMPPDGYDKGGKYPAGKVQEITYHSSVTNGDRKMEIYTPPGYSTSQKYPAIYAIHGVGAWPDTIFADWCVGASAVSDNLLGQKKIQPVIIVAMDNNNVDSHKELFDVIIPYIESHYPVIADADHRGIYGYSLGGGVTFAEGIGHLDTFHHISPSSAAPFNHPSDKDMFPNGGAEAKQKIKTLFISCGTADWDGFYPPNETTHKYCDDNGIPNYWLAVQGGGHDGGVWRPAMWNFLQLAFPANDGSGGSGGSGGVSGGAGGNGGVSGGAGGNGGSGGAAGSGGIAGSHGGGGAGGAVGATGGAAGAGGGPGTAGSGGHAGADGGASGATGGNAGGSAGSGSAGKAGTGAAGSSGGAKDSGSAGKGGQGGSSVTTTSSGNSGCSYALGDARANSISALLLLGLVIVSQRRRRQH